MSDKKSFIAYKNWKSTFDELSNEDAGKLVKHIFEYVNGSDEKSDSGLIRAVFANIKDTIDRDIEKWENQLEQRRLAGARSAEARKATSVNERSTTVDSRKRNSTDSVNVSDSDSDSDSVNENKEELTLWPNFEDFWNAYDKKVDRTKCERKWAKLNQQAKEDIMRHVDAYIPSTPDKKFRKNPYTYLNAKAWEDEEIINQQNFKDGQVKFTDLTPSQIAEYAKSINFY